MSNETAYIAACEDELLAPKPGNVHRFRDGHRMTVDDFQRSAAVSAPLVCAHGVSLGQRILTAVQATIATVGQNTNLGIILLCAPMAAGVERLAGLRSLKDKTTRAAMRLRFATVTALNEATISDTEAVFDAIRFAQPGGLGNASRYDVHAPATVPIITAMAEAAPRDSIARQWTHGFRDIFGCGLSRYEAARERWSDRSWATLSVYLYFLSAWPDSHVVRKHGTEVAAAVQQEAKRLAARLDGLEDPAALLPQLLKWDAALKADDINPGTSADLSVATIFAFRLQNTLPFLGDDG